LAKFVRHSLQAIHTAPHLLGCLLLLGMSVRAQVPVSHAYRDSGTGLVIHFREGWKIDRESSPFTIVSFDPRKRPPQVLVPLSGAEIVVTRPPMGVGSVADWLNSDRATAERGHHIATADVPTTYFATLAATVTRFRPDVIPEATFVVYYLDLKDRPLKVALKYRGQRRVEYFESVLLAVIKNLEPAKP